MISGITKQEQEIIEGILSKYPYSFWYYGSRTRDDFHKTSDLDILVKADKELPLSIINEIKDEFYESKLPYIVNLSDYHSITKSFYSSIKKDLIPICK